MQTYRLQEILYFSGQRHNNYQSMTKSWKIQNVL